MASLVNFQLRGDSLTHSLTACQAKAIVVGEELLDMVGEIRAQLPFLPVFIVGERGRQPSNAFPSGVIGLDKKLAKMPMDSPQITV